VALIFSDKSAYAAQVQAAFAVAAGASRFALWFPPNARFAESDGRLVLVCRNAHFSDWAAEQFGDTLKQVAATIAGREVAVQFVVDELRFQEPVAELAADKKPKPVNLFGERDVPAKPKAERLERAEKPTLRRWKAFNTFVTGASNRVAAAAAQAVAEEPGLGPNPLVIFGPVGTGKTHLLEAVYASLPRKSAPLFVTAEDFTHRFVQSTRHHRTSSFRKQFREAGGLCLDDLHFLANKRSTQEEFLHTLDALVADGRPVVLTMDTHPRLADDLLPELVDRLLGGAAWGVLPPDDETRLGILRSKAGAHAIPEPVLKDLARTLRGNVRELEGAVHALVHYAKVTRQPLTQHSAREALADLLRHTVRAVTLPMIDDAVCRVFKLAKGSLQGSGRSPRVTQPRMLAVLLARQHTTATFGEIAQHFGVRQHSTAVAAEKRARAWLRDNCPLPVAERTAAATDVLAMIERELAK
jgi:chromosomal replication initiator protein